MSADDFIMPNKSQKPHIVSDSNFNRNDFIIVSHAERRMSRWEQTENAVAGRGWKCGKYFTRKSCLFLDSWNHLTLHTRRGFHFRTAKEVSDIRHHHCYALSARRNKRQATKTFRISCSWAVTIFIKNNARVSSVEEILFTLSERKYYDV